MFSEASVILSTGREVGYPLPPEADHPSLLLTSSGSHCSGRYASYWNAFLVIFDFVIVYCVNEFHYWGEGKAGCKLCTFGVLLLEMCTYEFIYIRAKTRSENNAFPSDAYLPQQ